MMSHVGLRSVLAAFSPPRSGYLRLVRLNRTGYKKHIQTWFGCLLSID
jgi:hypothetical protein